MIILPPPKHGYALNHDACPLCGKNGLQLLQEGNPPCTQEARDAFALHRANHDWIEQMKLPEAR